MPMAMVLMVLHITYYNSLVKRFFLQNARNDFEYA